MDAKNIELVIKAAMSFDMSHVTDRYAEETRLPP